MKLRKIFRICASIPKTVYLNYRLLPFRQALRLPIFVAYDVKLGELRGTVEWDAPKLKSFMVRIGLGGSENIMAGKGYFSCGKKGKLVFSDHVVFGAGNSLLVNNGCACFGSSFTTNKNCVISCSCGLRFGADTMLGYQVSIRDSDGHPVLKNGVPTAGAKAVTVGAHVWLCSHSHVLKGCEIQDGSILAYGSIALGKFDKKNCLIGGYPAKLIQEGISWTRD